LPTDATHTAPKHTAARTDGMPHNAICMYDVQKYAHTHTCTYANAWAGGKATSSNTRPRPQR
jgi:hypothetical protein